MDSLLKSCIVIEDEPLSRQLLVHYANHVENLVVTAQFGDVAEALTYLQQNKVDVVLLDSVEIPFVPQSKWMQILDLHSNVIVVSAYPRKMLNLTHRSVKGMLEKPFSYHDFKTLITQIMN